MSSSNHPSINQFYKVARLSVRKFRFPCQVEEDLVQDVVLKCWEKYESLENQTSLNSWVSKIARNTCIDHYRKSAKVTNFSEIEGECNIEQSIPSKTYEISAKYEDDLGSIRNKVQSMDEGIRSKIAIGFYVDGMSVKDLSLKYSLKQNTVLSHLRRMRLSFSKKFKENYDFSYLNDRVQYCY